MSDLKAMEKAFSAMGAFVCRIVRILTTKIVPLARSIDRYAKAHTAEVLGSGKTHRLPGGGSFSYRKNPPRMSADDDDREDLFDKLEELGLGHCIGYARRIKETELTAAMKEDPTILEKLLEAAPSFALGEESEQLTFEFPGTDWQIKGNTATGEYLLVFPDKKRKKAA